MPGTQCSLRLNFVEMQRDISRGQAPRTEIHMAGKWLKLLQRRFVTSGSKYDFPDSVFKTVLTIVLLIQNLLTTYNSISQLTITCTLVSRCTMYITSSRTARRCFHMAQMTSIKRPVCHRKYVDAQCLISFHILNLQLQYSDTCMIFLQATAEINNMGAMNRAMMVYRKHIEVVSHLLSRGPYYLLCGG